MNSNQNKILILDTLEDLVTNFLYYDRKEDEEVPLNFIESSIDNNLITIEEIINHFEYLLKKGIGKRRIND